QRDAAMGAKLVDEADPTMGVAERDQAFRQNLGADRRTLRLRYLLRQQKWNPVATEQLAHRRPRTGAADEFVLLAGQHLPLLSHLDSAVAVRLRTLNTISAPRLGVKLRANVQTNHRRSMSAFGTTRTYRNVCYFAAFGGKADIERQRLRQQTV